jgi:two-component sensor histidine kinase
MEYDSFENPAPMCEEIAQMVTTENLLQRERKAYALIAEAAVYAKDIPDLCRMVIAGLVEILKFDLGVIRLKNGKDHSFMVMASAGISEGLRGKLQPAYLGDSESVSMLVLRTGKPIFAPDIDTNKIKQTHTARLAEFGGKAFIAWPLHDSSQKIMGVVTLIAYSPKKIPDKDRTFFKTIADMFALVVEHKIDSENIKKSLKEKELLLKEIHHRVKNNMQVISSLVSLQAGRVEDQDHKNLFNEIMDRIRSMALVHEQLYRTRDLSGINLKDYITQLSRRLMRSYDIKPDKIELKIDADDLYIGIDKAVPCGLITNELISNALKYAFPDDMKGRISVKLCKDDNGKILLNINDNGIGLSKEFNLQNADSLGLELVIMLVEQIDGSLDVTGDKGTDFMISFSA